MKSREVRAEAKRDQLVSAARALVFEVGFRQAQMAAVAARAGIAIGTVYRYFPARSDLMVEVVRRTSQREVDVIAGVAMGDGTATERLARAIWTFTYRALQGRRMAHALIAEPVEPTVETERLRYRRKLARVLETIIEEGERECEFPKQNVQASAACIVGSIFEGLVGPLAEEFSDAARVKHIEEIVAFCLRGVVGR